jgi:ABC-type Na+ transport system ATPase subunit NatA
VSFALRAFDADFVRDGETIVAPFSIALAEGDETTLEAKDALGARVLARMCAAMVKPTHGTVYVGDFETRLQPPQAKRLVGYVDADGFRGDAHAFRCEVAFRCDVWGLDRHAASERAERVARRLGGVADTAFAQAVALALVADVRLVVLDRPPLATLAPIRKLVPQAGILSVRIALPLALDAREPIGTST